MGLMKKLTSSIVASSLVLGLVGTAFAAPTADATNNAFERLSHYNIAKGKVLLDGTIDPALNDSITRAELVTVITRAFGQEETAKILAGAASFNDVATNEWYSGYVALAKNMAEKQGFPIGYEDGTFQPNKQVSAVEALAFIMKYLGVKPATGANWAADTVKAATEAGVITTADAEAYLADLNAPATRGLAFGLADTIFGSYNKLAGGKTVYTAFVDTQAPVVTLDKVEPTTAATTKISGKVSGDYTEVFIGTEKITVNEDGTFTAEVKLAVGENAISVIAKDLAGNEGVGSTTATRTTGTATKMTATLANAQIAVNGETELAIKVLDANDGEVTVPATDIKVTSNLGTYADGKFTAGTKAGKGTITASYGDLTVAADIEVLPGALAKIGADKTSVAPGAKVTLAGQDEFGNAIASGVEFSIDSTDAFVVNGVFVGTKAGTYEVTAKQGDKTATIKLGVYASEATALKVEAPASIIANDASYVEVKVAAVDKNGNTVGDYKGTIKLDGNGLIKAHKDYNVDLEEAAKNGVATFKIKTVSGAAIGGSMIELKATTTDGLESATGEIEAVAQVATSVSLTAPKYVASTDAGITTGTVKAQVVDQVGERMVSGVYNVKYSLTGPGYFTANDGAELSDPVAFIGEQADTSAEAQIKAKSGQTGVIAVTATVENLGTTTKEITAAVPTTMAGIQATIDSTNGNPGTAGTFGSANAKAVKVKLQLVDTNGVPMPPSEALKTAADSTVYVDSSKGVSTLSEILVKQDQGTADAPSVIDVLKVDTGKKVAKPVTFDENGKATLEVYAQKFVGDLDLVIKDMASKNALTTVNTSVSFQANKAAQYAMVSKGMYVTMTNPTATVKVQLFDEAGNKVKVAGKEFTFSSTDDIRIDGVKTAVKATTNADGIASVEATVPKDSAFTGAVKVSAVDAELIEIADSTATTFKVGYAVPASMTARVVNYDDTKKTVSTAAGKTADDLVSLFVQIKDTAGAWVNGTTIDPTSLELDEESAKLVAEKDITFKYVSELNGFVSEAPFHIKKAGANSLKVVSSATDVSAVARTSIAAGVVDHYVVKQAVDRPDIAAPNKAILVSKNKISSALTIEAQDQYDNPAILVNYTDAGGAAKVGVQAQKVILTVDQGDGYVEIRTSTGGRDLVGEKTANEAELSIAAGSTTTTFYVLTNSTTGTITVDGTVHYLKY